MISRTLQLILVVACSCLAVRAQGTCNFWYATAVHEASHGAAVMEFGGIVTGMEIGALGEGIVGLTHSLYFSGGENRAKIALAGHVGEKLFCGIPIPQPAFPNRGTDFDHARESAGEDFMRLVPEVEALLLPHRQQIIRIADELYQRRSLTGLRISLLYNSAATKPEEPGQTKAPGRPVMPPPTRSGVGEQRPMLADISLSSRNVIRIGLVLFIVWLLLRARKSLPIHEAGHAVTTLAQDGSLSQLFTRIVHGKCFGSHPDPHKMAIIYAGGTAAEAVCGPRSPESLVWQISPDYANAVSLVGVKGIPAAMADARRICAEHKEEIELIAKELGCNGYMSGARAKQLFQRPAKEREREERRERHRQRHLQSLPRSRRVSSGLNATGAKSLPALRAQNINHAEA